MAATLPEFAGAFALSKRKSLPLLVPKNNLFAVYGEYFADNKEPVILVTLYTILVFVVFALSHLLIVPALLPQYIIF